MTRWNCKHAETDGPRRCPGGAAGISHQNWDVLPGDREFLTIRSTDVATGLFVILNWPQLHTIQCGGGPGGER